MTSLTKIILLLPMLLSLVACGHGFEGEYQGRADTSLELLDIFTDAAGSTKFVIGPDYIDQSGHRTQFEEIFVRNSGSERYLIFKYADNSEDVWKIIDDNTLMQGTDIMSLKLVRIP